MELTHFSLDVDEDGVATVLMDRAGESMNTLGPEVGPDLERIIDRLESDDAIRAVVLGSAKPDNFLAGADIRWFAELTDASEATELLGNVQKAFDRIEQLHQEKGKPVVAAIHGPCLGGGLELALACGERVSSDDERKTQFGQPEVQIGVIPGAGGTQRLPRLIGITAALDLILTGRRIRPSRAKRLGLVDEVVPAGDLLERARRRALAALSPPPAPQLSLTDRFKQHLTVESLKTIGLERNPIGRRVLFAQAEKAMLKQTGGNYPAPPVALTAVRVGAEKGVAAGLAAEREGFARLVMSPEARALRGIFFATQELKRDTGVAGEVEPTQINRVGVLGGGLMGGGIAAVNTTRAKVVSIIKEVDDAGVERGLAYVKRVLDDQVKRRRIQRGDAWLAMRRNVQGTTSYEDLEDTELIIEAVFEDLDLKRAVLGEVEAVTRESTIFASNTSSIPITDIAAEAKRPENVIGMHYFSPVEKMPLLEIIVTDRTADWVTATCVEFGKRQGKNVIVVNDGTGFYTTRIIAPYAQEVLYLLEDGATIDEIDRSMVKWGFPVGPVTLSDEVGIDVGAKIAKIMEAAFGERMKAPARFESLLADGRQGRKSGRGFYLYKDNKKGDVDESVYAILGVTPRAGSISAQLIQDRLSLQFVNEAVRCLEEGILRSPRDGDIGAVMGLGFPPFRGGPFRWVDEVGPGAVVDKLHALQAAHGDRFAAAAMLEGLAARNGRFYE